MTSLFRKFTWWLQRRRKEDELREELQFHLAEEADERQADGLSEDQAQMGRPPRPGQRDAAAGRHAHAVDVDPARAARAGPALRPADDVQEPRVHGAGRAVARAGDRRQHGDLQLHGLDPAALAAGVGSGVAGRGEVAQQAVRSTAGERVRHALHRRQHLSATAAGTTAAIFPFPAFERLQEASAPVLSSLFAYYPAGNVNVMIKGEAELAKGEYVSGDFFRGLAVSPAAGRLIAADDDRAGAPPVAVISMGYSQRRFGGAAERDRPADSDQQRAVHRGRRRRRPSSSAWIPPRRPTSISRCTPSLLFDPDAARDVSSTRTTTGSR